MKADVFLPPAPLELDVPSWVPEGLARRIRANYAEDVRAVYVEAIRKCEPDVDEFDAEAWAEQADVRASYADFVHGDLIELVERYRPLACGGQMRGVWRELSKLRKGSLLYPALKPVVADELSREVALLLEPATTDAQERQAAAMFELFKTALGCHHLRASPTRAEVDRQRRHFLALADALESDAITMLVQHLRVANDLHSDESFARMKKLQAAAVACKEHAHVLTRAQPSLPERDRNGSGRPVAVTISNKFRALFGQPMYGLTAKIASVVLDRKIGLEAVRLWLAKP